MITFNDNTFYLETARTSYWFRVTEHDHLEHVYFGPRLPVQPAQALAQNTTAEVGSAVAYADDSKYWLDTLPLEFSGRGHGDYRHSPCVIERSDGQGETDFRYNSHTISSTSTSDEAHGMPRAHGPRDVLTVEMVDGDLVLTLTYEVFASTDVIIRSSSLKNNGPSQVDILHLASSMIDVPNQNFQVRTFDGAWIKEAHANDRQVSQGTFSVGSLTGASSNQHNPGFMVFPTTTTQTQGHVLGFNLIYSGNHQSRVELNHRGLVRISQGLHSEGFRWPLSPTESFETPQAVLSFSANGFNGLSQQMHRFVREHVQPAQYLDLERPVVYNGWEALMFDFDERRQLSLAKKAKKLGMELFVVDDGWFEGRRSDTAGLGDYGVDRKRFPRGLGHFAKKVQDLGMKFGIWFEPEMTNPDSNLYRKHPDWVLRTPNKEPHTGRHQYVLDLCNPEVRDYIVASVCGVLDSAPIDYVKWDMNRHIADASSNHVENQGMVPHSYMLGLYDILDRIFKPRPHVMLEMCSSGGNRFDLGMLAYSAMIWSSDNTDPIERLKIQEGLSYLYPLATISAHVSNSPHQQTLRSTPLSTRFNVACFGTLGYEYDLELLSPIEKKEIVDQIKFYREHRRLFQYGDFYRMETVRPNLRQWQVTNGEIAVSGNFQSGIGASPAPDRLPILGLNPALTYQVESKPQRLMIERFGALIQHVLPVRLDPRGRLIQTANRHRALQDAHETYRGTGGLLAQGIALQSQFQGTYYNEHTRLLGDFGSTLYVTTPKNA